MSSTMSPPRREAAVLEVVPQDPRYSTRWHRHDYPSPLARWNFHPEYELHLITSTSGRYIVGDSVGRFAPGQLVLVGPEVPHDWISDFDAGTVAAGRDVVLQFHDRWIRACQGLLPELRSLDPLLAASVRGIEFLGDTAVEGARLLTDVGTADGAGRVAKVFELLHLLADAPAAECRSLSAPWNPSTRDARAQEVVGGALDYIFANLLGEVRLSVAARTAGMSDSAFSRYFKTASGQTFSDMVRRLRLAHACTLLDTTELSVASVAQASGYRNLSNFNRQFREEYGCTPLAYRRSAAG
ncbi:AraC family transcriptional regulator [Arthrobacter celericrescens]|uniref:AraC family transcriptional regulator n=1 Tax=Arthrobacter celericrescens TaxID=2320851 RepID=UPI0013C50495|nr:AraC family transcriptional regulator [Arthrobacter celericrescens]